MENLNNLPPFYVGQKVVYITGIAMPKNSIHIVKNIFKLDCGCYSIRIEIPSDTELSHPSSNSTRWRCNMCEKLYKITPENINKTGWASKSFRAVEKQKFPLISYSKVLKEVEVGSN